MLQLMRFLCAYEAKSSPKRSQEPSCSAKRTETFESGGCGARTDKKSARQTATLWAGMQGPQRLQSADACCAAPKFDERTGNVYENKGSPVYRGRAWGRPLATTPNPSLPRRGMALLTTER